MDGLEAVEIRLAKIEIDNEESRIDSEFFKKQYLSEEAEKNKYSKIKLGEVAFITDGQHGYHEIDIMSNISHITAKNTKWWFADNAGCDKLSKQTNDNNKRSILAIDDILLSTRGSVGYCAIVNAEILPANIDQDIARIMLLDRSIILPAYLLTFINSKYGQDWTRRNATGMVQQGLSLDKVRKMKIPLLKMAFQLSIQNVIDHAYGTLCKSNEIYLFSETLLLSHLGLDSHILNPEGIAVKRLSQSFGTSGRLDSEYYQPKYEEIEGYIKNYQNGCVRLDNYLKCINTGEYSESYSPRKAGLVFYIRSTNISKGLIENDDDYYVNPKHFKRQVKTGDIITARVGTIGIFGEITEEFNNSIYSDNILCFRLPSECIPSVYTLLFNSSIMYELVDRLARGSVQQRLNQETLKDLFIPILEKDIQLEIAEKVQQSFALRKQSAQLLELAKTAVEIAIEQGEEKALAMLEGVRI